MYGVMVYRCMKTPRYYDVAASGKSLYNDHMDTTGKTIEFKWSLYRSVSNTNDSLIAEASRVISFQEVFH